MLDFVLQSEQRGSITENEQTVPENSMEKKLNIFLQTCGQIPAESSLLSCLILWIRHCSLKQLSVM